MSFKNYFEANKALWNQKTPVHVASDFYNMDAFMNGENSLTSIELELLGNPEGKTILHLQCHFGQDSLSLQRMGAQVCGVDLSNKAIDKARELNDALKLNATFVESNVLDLPKAHQGEYDIVFTSYGTITWLPDLAEWARVINHFLKPGGQFIMAEFHPFIWTFDDDLTKIAYPYFNDGVIHYEEEGTYANRESNLKHTAHVWNHSIAEVFESLRKQELSIDVLKEYDYSPYNIFPDMIERNQREYTISKFGNKVPLVYALRALKAS